MGGSQGDTWAFIGGTMPPSWGELVPTAVPTCFGAAPWVGGVVKAHPEGAGRPLLWGWQGQGPPLERRGEAGPLGPLVPPLGSANPGLGQCCLHEKPPSCTCL